MTFPYSIGMYDAVITNLQITLQDINISEQVQALISPALLMSIHQ